MKFSEDIKNLLLLYETNKLILSQEHTNNSDKPNYNETIFIHKQNAIRSELYTLLPKYHNQKVVILNKNHTITPGRIYQPSFVQNLSNTGLTKNDINLIDSVDKPVSIGFYVHTISKFTTELYDSNDLELENDYFKLLYSNVEKIKNFKFQ